MNIWFSALPKNWSFERYIETLNKISRIETGFPVFFKSANEAQYVNTNAGASPDNFEIITVTLERKS